MHKVHTCNYVHTMLSTIQTLIQDYLLLVPQEGGGGVRCSSTLVLFLLEGVKSLCSLPHPLNMYTCRSLATCYMHATRHCSITFAMGTDSGLSNDIIVSTLRAKSTSFGNPDTSDRMTLSHSLPPFFTMPSPATAGL